MCLRALSGCGVALACALVLAGTAQASSGRDSLRSMGMVYAGLKHVAGGPCGFLYQVDMPGRARCTHGPDPAPAGVDVRERRPLSDLTASLPARALFATSPTASLVPCIGNGTEGARVQAVYAHPQGTADDLVNVAPLIKAYAAQVEETYERSAAETGGMRRIRWVTAGCDLSILDVVARADSVDHTFDDLVAAGLKRSDRKYLVWMDANEICGVGESYNDTSRLVSNKNNGPTNIPGMVARIDQACWGEYDNLARGSTEAHELTHTLGAVLSNAPHATHYGHCFDGYDVMCYGDGPGTVLQTNFCPFTHQRLLDCGHDDYFSTNPAPNSFLAKFWNTANNRFLDGAPSDVAPPLVHAQAAKVQHGKTGKLHFDVSDDSGTSSILLAVFRGQKQLKKWGPEDVSNGSYYVSWKAPAKAQRLDFCIAAQDEAGNKSGTVCAALKVT